MGIMVSDMKIDTAAIGVSAYLLLAQAERHTAIIGL